MSWRSIVVLALGLPFAVAAASAQTYTDSPYFKDSGLPPVADRLPTVPRVVTGKEIGRYGGNLRLLMASSRDTRMMTVYGYARLVAFDTDFEIVPDILESFEVEEGRIFTFKLRAGHKWSDGEPFNVDDIMFFVNDILGNETLTASVWGAWSAGDERVRAEKIDDLTVKIIFSQPNPIFLSYLATSGSYFSPWAAEHVLKKLHIKYNPNADSEAKAAGFEDWTSRFKTFYNKWKDAVTATEFGLQVPTLESHVPAEPTHGQTRNLVAHT